MSFSFWMFGGNEFHSFSPLYKGLLKTLDLDVKSLFILTFLVLLSCMFI